MTKKERRKWEKVLRKFEKKKKKEARAKKKVNPIISTGARLLMTVRNVSGTYSIDDGTQLPGSNQESRILGMNNNNFGMSAFVFGKQGYDIWGRENGYSIANLSASNGWLVQNENLNKQFSTTHSTKLNLRATLEPLKDLNIEMKLNRNYGRNSGEFFRWNETSQQFEGQSRFESATLTYSTITWASAFMKDNKDRSSEVFSNLLANREAVSQLIGAGNPNSSLLPSGYFDGYSGNQQEVVIGAFLTGLS